MVAASEEALVPQVEGRPPVAAFGKLQRTIVQIVPTEGLAVGPVADVPGIAGPAAAVGTGRDRPDWVGAESGAR